jgi:hypothetical protein
LNLNESIVDPKNTTKIIPDKLTPMLFSQIAYIDEDDDLKFINANKNLLNNTEQDVYVVCRYIHLLFKYRLIYLE